MICFCNIIEVLSLILRRGVIKFENHRVVFRFFRVYIVFGAHGPAYADGAHCLRQTGGPWLFAGAVSDKLRARQHVGEQAAQCECQRLRLIPKRGGRVGKLSPQHILRIFPEPAHDARVKALDAVGAVVRAHQRQPLFAKLVVAPPRLEFNDHGRSAAHHFKHLRQQGDRLLCAAQTHPAQLLECKFVHTAVHAAHTVQRVVVEHHDLPVPGELDIQLHAVAGLRRRAERGQAVLRHRLILRMQAPVRVVYAVHQLLLRLAVAARPQKKPQQNDAHGQNPQKYRHSRSSHFPAHTRRVIRPCRQGPPGRRTGPICHFTALRPRRQSAGTHA